MPNNTDELIISAIEKLQGKWMCEEDRNTFEISGNEIKYIAPVVYFKNKSDYQKNSPLTITYDDVLNHLTITSNPDFYNFSGMLKFRDDNAFLITSMDIIPSTKTVAQGNKIRSVLYKRIILD